MNASSNHHDVGAFGSGNRLSQTPRGQSQSTAEWVGGVNENDVSIAGQWQMLKTIVEDKPLRSMPRQDLAILVSIRAHADLHFSGKAFTQERHFIALRLAARAPAHRPTISARQDRRALSLPGQALRNPQYHWRFARAADREVSDADDCSRQLSGSEDGARVTPHPRASRHRVQHC